jgi:hypothetical protein
METAAPEAAEGKPGVALALALIRVLEFSWMLAHREHTAIRAGLADACEEALQRLADVVGIPIDHGPEQTAADDTAEQPLEASDEPEPTEAEVAAMMAEANLG